MKDFRPLDKINKIQFPTNKIGFLIFRQKIYDFELPAKKSIVVNFSTKKNDSFESPNFLDKLIFFNFPLKISKFEFAAKKCRFRISRNCIIFNFST